MSPQVKSTIIFSALGLSLAINAAFVIGYLRGHEGNNTRGNSSATHQVNGTYCLLDRLDLDAAQQNRLAEMRRAMHEKRTAYWQRATAIKVELAEAICDTETDKAAFDVPLERYSKNQAAMQHAVAQHLLGVNAMLHPKQRNAFRALLRTEMFSGIRSSRGLPDGKP